MWKYTDYPKRVLSGQITAGLYIRQACQRFLDWLERPDMTFDSAKVDRVITFIQRFKHYSGKSAGKPFILSPFQVWIVAAIYGFYWTGTDNRVIRNVYIEMARKQGKSAFASVLALYHLIADGEQNAEVDIVANSAKQAGILYQMSRYFADELDPRHKFISSYRDKLKFTPTKSTLQTLTSESGTNDGWNASCFVIDEYHAAPTSEMYDVMVSSQGQRENPLGIVITTAGFNLYGACHTMRATNIEILAGLKTDDSVFAAIYTLDEGDDWQNRDVWQKSNPNLGVTVTTDYLNQQVTQAMNNESLKAGVLTKNFNLWLQSATAWITPDLINQSSSKVNLADYDHSSVYIGVDLSSVSDLTAVTVLIPGDKYVFKTWYYLPAETLKNGLNAIQYREWARNKHLRITDGNVCDYDYILNDIMRMQADHDFAVQGVFYDTWNSVQFAIAATAQGLPMVPFSQSLGNFNKPTKEFERLIKSGQVILDNNPITRYCFKNVALKSDWNDNVKPIKAGSENNKIDGVISIVESLGGYLSVPQYDNQIGV